MLDERVQYGYFTGECLAFVHKYTIFLEINGTFVRLPIEFIGKTLYNILIR